MIALHRVSDDEILLTLSRTVSPEEAEKVFQRILATPYRKVTIDCSGVSQLDYPTLGKLYMFSLDLEIRKKKLALCGCTDGLRNSLNLLKLGEKFAMTADPPHRMQADAANAR
jgi:anti-anti-sigma regulatory factor